MYFASLFPNMLTRTSRSMWLKILHIAVLNKSEVIVGSVEICPNTIKRVHETLATLETPSIIISMETASPLNIEYGK